ncbi:MAG: protoheme IX farnesyltransferase [Planctomycetota bacterium]|nr:protoheme IX farnesyltransferase [Planctomycetota bacterium]
MGLLRLLLQLSKARITFAVTFSVSTGYVVFGGAFDADLVWPALGVFMLACGSAALNQVQEWRTDAKMPRTQDRPIPAGRISARGAAMISVLFMAVGFNLLAQVENHTLTVLALGAFAVVYYNGIYWALKRITAFAVVPGALIGAVPPVIGWCAAGGWWWDPAILEIGGFFFIWQIPHFWLLARLYGEQYEDAGLPTPAASLSPRQFQRITVNWIVLTAFFGLLLAGVHRIAMPWNFLALAGSIAITFAAIGYMRGEPKRAASKRLFMQLNMYALAMMLLLMAHSMTR